jgi:hypothetical protein
MKLLLHLAWLRFRISLLVSSFILIVPQVFAQDKDLEISIGVEKPWYQQPWAWVIGAAVFILLLVAILRGGRRKG